MAVPAPVLAAATPAPAAVQTAPVAASNELVPYLSAQANPASRAETLKILNENSWQFFTILNARIPGILIQRGVQEQMLFSPFHACHPSPYTKEELSRASFKTLDALLESSQKAVAQYLQAHEAEITQLEFEDEVNTQATPKAVTVNGHYCVPQNQFSAMPAPEGQEWTMKREKKREASKIDSAAAEEPLSAKISRKPEEAPLTNDEVRKLITWIAWLREFRQSEGLYEAFHDGEGSLPALPEFQVALGLGQKIERIQSGLAIDRANKIFRADEDKFNPPRRLTPAMITAAKIYSATSSVIGMPKFVPCAGGKSFCFQDGSKTPVEALDEKIVLALQNPDLKPGAYLDALVMLAKRTSVVELAAVNSQLPVRLRKTTLPSACTEPKKDVSFLGDGVNEYEAILKSFSDSGEIEWWVNQINQGVQELVSNYNLRKILPAVPPSNPTKVGDQNIYQVGQAQVKQWIADFFKEYRSKVSDPKNVERWDKVGEALAKQTDERTFADDLRHQMAQGSQDDFASILGEKLIILFSAIRSDLASNLNKVSAVERKQTITELVRRLVESALGDSLAIYALGILDPRVFLAAGPNGAAIPMILAPQSQAYVFWRHKFEARWRELLDHDGFADTQAIAESIVAELYRTKSVQATLELKDGYRADAVARENIQANLNKALPTLTEAARAQETVEYMRTLVNWQNNAFARFYTTGSYDSAVQQAMTNGSFDGTESACFYVPDGKGHGKGINTFGTLNPLKEGDYDHLKKALAAIAGRHHKELSKRLGEQYPDAVLQKSLAVANADTLTNIVLEKFSEVLEAQHSRDRGRVSAIRREEFAPLQKWLDQATSSEAWYKSRTERLAKALFENEIKPLLALRPQAGDPKVKGWEEYFNNRLKALFESRFPLSTAPTAAAFLAAYDKSGVNDASVATSELDSLRGFLKGISDQGLFAGADPQPTEFIKLCTSQPDRCLGWLDAIETLTKGETMTKLQSARLGYKGSLGLAGTLQLKKAANFSDTDRKKFTRGSWFLEPLPGELWFKGDSSLKPLWGSNLRKKLATLAEADKKALQTTLIDPIDSVLKDRQEQIAKTYTEFKAFLGQLTIAKPTVPQLQAILVQYISTRPEIVEARKTHLLKITAVLRTLIKSGNVDALNDAFPVFLQLVDFELKPLVATEVVAVLETAKADPFHTSISKQFLPGFFDFRAKAISLIADVTVPQIEVTEELLQLEKKISKSGDGEALLNKTGKGASADAKTIREGMERLSKARAQALQRRSSLVELSQLLRVFGDELEEGKKALAALEKVEPHDDIFATLYSDFRNTRPEGGLSPGDILQDLNQMASLTRGTLPAVVTTARKYLQEVQSYCVAGRSDKALAPDFAKAYEQVLKNDIKEAAFDSGAADRISNLAKVPAPSKTTFLNKVFGVANEATATMASADWKKLDSVLEKMKIASGQAAKFDGATELLASLPSVEEFCGYVESKAGSLEKEIADLAPEAQTSEKFRANYWELVDLVSGVFQGGEGVFAPLVRRVEKGIEVVGLKSSPTDSLTVKYDTITALLGIATPALTEFLAQKPTQLVLDKVWTPEFFTATGIAPLTEADVADPIAWLNRTKLTSRVQLYVQLKDYLMETMVSGNDALELAAKWTPLTTQPVDAYDRPLWSERLTKLALLWESVSENINIADDASKGAWKRLAQELVWTMVQGTLYRVQGDLLLAVESDGDRTKQRETQELIFSEKVDLKNLRRWADAVSAILDTANRRRAEGEVVTLPQASLKESGATVSSEATYFLAYASLFYLEPDPATVGAEALQWQQQYAISSALGFHTFSSQPLSFNDSWKPTGQVGTQASDFETWFNLVVSYGGEKGFQTLREKKDPKVDRSHLWQRYESLEKFKADPKGEYAQLMAFLKKWDANAAATDAEQTYPFFLALLNWNIRHYDTDLTLGPDSERQPLVESFLAHRQVSLVHELGIQLDNFEGWREVLVKQGEPTDWLLMADNKRTLLVDVGAQRFFSTAIEAAQVENPYSGATYHYRSFPLVSQQERTRGASDDESYAKWYAKSQDPHFTSLHRVMEGDRPQVGGFEQLVADGLELQGATTVAASAPAKKADGSAVVAKRGFFREGLKNWDAYFANAISRAEKELTPELVKKLQQQVADSYADQKREAALPTSATIHRVVRDREALVALRAAASELLVRYSGEAGSLDLSRVDWFRLETDLNAMVQAYGRQVDFKGKIPAINLTAWRVAERHRQGAGKAIFLGSNILLSKLTLGKTADEQKEVEAVMAAADAHYRQEKQTNTYTTMLLTVGDNIQKNLTALCEERRMISEITDQKSFDAAHDRIWKLKLPLMDNLFEVAEELSPPGAGDGPRRMLQVMLAEDDLRKEKEAWWDAKIMQASGVLFVGFVMATRHPGIARLAATSPAWATGIKYGMGSLNWALGGWFGYRVYSEIHEDFVTAPESLAAFSQVRDSQLYGFRPLMSDETAAGRDPSAAALLERQRSGWVWFQRLLQSAITIDMIGVPLLKFVCRLPWTVPRALRWVSAEMRGAEAVAANAERQFTADVVADTGTAVGRLGQRQETYEVLKAAEAESRLSAAELDTLKSKMGAWEADGQLVPSKPMVDALLTDVRAQMTSAGKVAEIDPISMRSLAKEATPEVVEFQKTTFAKLRYLKSIENKLMSSVPHVTADDLTVLLAQEGNPLSRHRPWYLQVLGLPTFNPNAWRLRAVWKIAAAGNDANRALSFYYMSTWIQKSRGDIRDVATALNRSEMDVLTDILEGRIYAKGRPNPSAGAAGKRLKESADELREIFKLGGLKAEPGLLDTLLREDFENLSTLYASGQKPLVLAKAAADRLSGEQKAPEALFETPVLPASSRPVLNSELLQSMERGFQPSKLSVEFAPYNGYLKTRIPERVAGVQVDVERVLALAEKYSSQDLQTLLGRHFKVRGMAMDSTVAELRIAAETRRAIELELSGKQYRPFDGSVTKLFDEMFQARMKDFDRIAQREMSLAEAKSIIGLDAGTVHWKMDEVVMKAEHMASPFNADAVDTAASLLKDFARNERRLWKTEDVLKVLDVSPEYLQVDALRARLLDYYGPLRVGAKLSHSEYLHLSGCLSSHPPTTRWEAEAILGMTAQSQAGSALARQTVQARAEALKESLFNAKNAIGNIQEAEKILLNELGL